MSKVNLKKLWKIASQSNQPLLGLSTDLATLDFMEEYLESYQAFDRDIARQKGFFWPTWNLEDEETESAVFQQWQKDVYYFLLKNKENYARLYALLSIEYEPLQNYDKHSFIDTTEDGQDVLTDNIGARHSEDDIAQRQDTNAYGATSETSIKGQREDTNAFGATSETLTKGQRQDTTTHGQITVTDNFGAITETDTIGAVSNSDVHGAENTTSENEVAGFNSGTYQDSDKTTTNKGSVTDTHTEQSRTNGHSETAHSDTHTTGQNDDTFTEGSQTNTNSALAHTDTYTEGSQTDTNSALAHTDTLTQGAHLDKHDERATTDSHTTDYGKTVGVDEHTYGNIGVTTSQQMAQSEVDLWNSFKFYDIMFNDIIKNLCNYYDEGYDCF